MTAVVGILNKHAIAIAADSAVTIDGVNGKKIFNRANKVFTLSKYHPVGIMLYNSGSFMATPWEIIIKVYRKQLADKPFGTVQEYQQNFIEFLRHKNFYSNEIEEKTFLEYFTNSLVGGVVKEIVNENKNLVHIPTDENKQSVLTKIEAKVDEYIIRFNNPEQFCDDFKDFSKEEFDELVAGFYEQVIISHFTNHGYVISDQLRAKISELSYIYLKVKETFTNFTGLIFVGFGEDEIYPSLMPVNISLSLRVD